MKVRGDENPHWKRTKAPGDWPRPNPSRVHGCRFSPSPFPLPWRVPGQRRARSGDASHGTAEGLVDSGVVGPRADSPDVQSEHLHTSVAMVLAFDRFAGTRQRPSWPNPVIDMVLGRGRTMTDTRPTSGIRGRRFNPVSPTYPRGLGNHAPPAETRTRGPFRPLVGTGLSLSVCGLLHHHLADHAHPGMEETDERVGARLGELHRERVRWRPEPRRQDHP